MGRLPGGLLVPAPRGLRAGARGRRADAARADAAELPRDLRRGGRRGHAGRERQRDRRARLERVRRRRAPLPHRHRLRRGHGPGVAGPGVGAGRRRGDRAQVAPLLRAPRRAEPRRGPGLPGQGRGRDDGGGGRGHDALRGPRDLRLRGDGDGRRRQLPPQHGRRHLRRGDHGRRRLGRRGPDERVRRPRPHRGRGRDADAARLGVPRHGLGLHEHEPAVQLLGRRRDDVRVAAARRRALHRPGDGRVERRAGRGPVAGVHRGGPGGRLLRERHRARLPVAARPGDALQHQVPVDSARGRLARPHDALRAHLPRRGGRRHGAPHDRVLPVRARHVRPRRAREADRRGPGAADDRRQGPAPRRHLQAPAHGRGQVRGGVDVDDERHPLRRDEPGARGRAHRGHAQPPDARQRDGPGLEVAGRERHDVAHRVSGRLPDQGPGPPAARRGHGEADGQPRRGRRHGAREGRPRTVHQRRAVPARRRAERRGRGVVHGLRPGPRARHGGRGVPLHHRRQGRLGQHALRRAAAVQVPRPRVRRGHDNKQRGRLVPRERRGRAGDADGRRRTGDLRRRGRVRRRVHAEGLGPDDRRGRDAGGRRGPGHHLERLRAGAARRPRRARRHRPLHRGPGHGRDRVGQLGRGRGRGHRWVGLGRGRGVAGHLQGHRRAAHVRRRGPAGPPDRQRALRLQRDLRRLRRRRAQARGARAARRQRSGGLGPGRHDQRDRQGLVRRRQGVGRVARARAAVGQRPARARGAGRARGPRPHPLRGQLHADVQGPGDAEHPRQRDGRPDEALPRGARDDRPGRRVAPGQPRHGEQRRRHHAPGQLRVGRHVRRRPRHRGRPDEPGRPAGAERAQRHADGARRRRAGVDEPHHGLRVGRRLARRRRVGRRPRALLGRRPPERGVRRELHGRRRRRRRGPGRPHGGLLRADVVVRHRGARRVRQHEPLRAPRGGAGRRRLRQGARGREPLGQRLLPLVPRRGRRGPVRRGRQGRRGPARVAARGRRRDRHDDGRDARPRVPRERDVRRERDRAELRPPDVARAGRLAPRGPQRVPRAPAQRGRRGPQALGRVAGPRAARREHARLHGRGRRPEAALRDHALEPVALRERRQRGALRAGSRREGRAGRLPLRRDVRHAAGRPAAARRDAAQHEIPDRGHVLRALPLPGGPDAGEGRQQHAPALRGHAGGRPRLPGRLELRERHVHAVVPRGDDAAAAGEH